jgi:peptide-methionine (S)-S-oxide reductase
MALFGQSKQVMVEPERALPGRSTAMVVPERHEVLGTPLEPPFPDGLEEAYFALGCFWGAERKFWEAPGVFSTAAGYAGGFTPNPTYEEVCSAKTGHAETVRVVFNPTETSYEQLLALYFESHDPTSGMRQGNDVGTQYRSMILTTSAAQAAAAGAYRSSYEKLLVAAGYGKITTEIVPLGSFYDKTYKSL